MNEEQNIASGNEKAIRLVEYLSQIARLRTKSIREISEYEKVLWVSDIPKEPGCFTQAWGQDEEYDEWIEVKNHREPELPIRPSECEKWINLDILRNKNDIPELLTEITQRIQNPDWQEGLEQPETILHTEYLEDHPEVERAWSRYIEDKWLPWTEEHNKWEKVHKVYTELFAIHQLQLRLGEEYELVLGLGLLTWQTPTGQSVCRHLVTAKASLEFEAHLQKFTVRPHTEGSKLCPELDMLDIEDQPVRAEETAKNSLTEANDDPWQKGCIEGVLKALVHSINSQGDYEDSLEAKNTRASGTPSVKYGPALILRKRSSKGLTEILRRIKEQIENGGAIPGEFADIAEIPRKNDFELSSESEEINALFNGEIFFPKPSNEEQRRIMDKIRVANGVLVQGPPGTGKSHTIANLICHLLATGQRMLITAKTPRALKVLDGLLPEELRPLCINLLGSGLEERRSLESSVGGILRKSEEWNEDSAEYERRTLEKDLDNLRKEKVQVNRRLRDIRESETYTQSIAEGTYKGTAARIAEAVNRDRSSYEWFEDSVTLNEACPIATSDLHSILLKLRQFTPEKRYELSLEWPKAMLSPEHFAGLVEKEIRAIENEQNLAKKADEQCAYLLARMNPTVIETILDTLLAFQEARRKLLANPNSWITDALRDIYGGNSSLWHEILRVTQATIASVEQLVTLADDARIALPDSIDIRSLYDDVGKLKEHMENGGKLGWGLFRSKLVKERLYIVKSVKVSGRPCTTTECFSNLADVLKVRIECEKAWSFWSGKCQKTEGPYTLQVAGLKFLCDALENALAIETLIAECREALKQCPGLSEPLWADESQVEKVVASCRLALARIHKRGVDEEIQTVETPVSQLAATNSAHPMTNELLSAIRNRDIDEFARYTNQIQDLEKECKHFQELDESISKLRHLFPKFTESLEKTCNEQYWEERIQNIDNAWHWAQAWYWIENYIRQEDLPALAKRSKQIDDEINKIIAKLASLHAWSFCFSRLQEDHRRHMEAWQQSMRRLGRGTGRHATRHRREAQEHLNKCREAVPAWVMPLHRVWDTVYPASGVFDVIIVDEASQCGIEALPLFYLGKKILIVGDDKQISPDAVGLQRDSIHRLIEEFLHDFHFKSSFSIESSLFDHGKLRYGTQRITLREHFRCMPEIIRFSNDLCYSDTPLIPLRQYGPDRAPPLEHVFVSGGYREGSNNRTINRPEAEAIVERIAEMCGNSDYSKKTMGVVVLQGEAQASLIESLLLEQLRAEEIEQRRLVCGNPYSFQGDERDIMFLSLVAASNQRIGTLTKSADERRFNVAASRARDMMILFHSVTCNDLSNICLRKRLLDFFENTRPQQIAGIERDELERRAAQDNRLVVKAPVPFGSWFEVDVALELLRKGYTVLAQYEIAQKYIDLVVEGGQARLAIECDGDHWHGPDQYEADMQRQRQLERCGWEFFRVRESAFYADRKKALSELWQMLEERNIFAGSNYEDTQPEDDFKENDGSTKSNDDTAENDGNVYTYEDSSSAVITSGSIASGRRVEDITDLGIQDAILSALAKCPNHSCTLHSLTSKVLKEVGIITRGKPRVKFENRVLRSVDSLEKHAYIEKYKATNQRIRLINKKP